MHNGCAAVACIATPLVEPIAHIRMSVEIEDFHLLTVGGYIISLAVAILEAAQDNDGGDCQ